MADTQPATVAEQVESKIFLVRGQQVMLDMHLAEMYEIEFGVLNRAVERNFERFPEGSVFGLSAAEIAGLNTRIAIRTQTTSYAFTGQGMAMLASILLDESVTPDDRGSCAPTCGCQAP